MTTVPAQPSSARDFRFGVIICYEDTNPYLARQYVAPAAGQPVDFLLNISNDGWFDGTSEHEQHLAICRFRAVECRRSVLRSVNMGISAVVDGNGRVLRPDSGTVVRSDGAVESWAGPTYNEILAARDADLSFVGRLRALLGIEKQVVLAKPLSMEGWHEFKKVAGVLTHSVPVDSRPSLYAQWGDWLPATCGGILLIGVAFALVRPVRREETAAHDRPE
jgi:apolipoprotein N-acyltransferase